MENHSDKGNPGNNSEPKKFLEFKIFEYLSAEYIICAYNSIDLSDFNSNYLTKLFEKAPKEQKIGFSTKKN